METWEVREDDYFRQKIILLRHYFPGVNIDDLDEEDFARLVCDAEWMHSQMVITRHANALGL
ncbi:hypothetical protein E5358_05465 [Palleniella muris]|uniref:Uncharacterized protein n=1 Tax=Palleniella muris TaxID=3038145 RepID=A0AC61QRD2_9BACT|nr:hypothetical protein E5358_05465 [Palleniella muris]